MKKKIAFLSFPEDKLKTFQNLLEDTEYEIAHFQSLDELFHKVYNQDVRFYAIMINSLQKAETSLWISEMKEHLKQISLNMVVYDNESEINLKTVEIDNYIHEESISKESLLILFRGAEKLTELLDTGLHITNDYYHFEFLKKIIHIEIKRVKRYQIPLTMMYLTFDNSVKMKKKSLDDFQKLFLNFSDKISTSIRDIDIPITLGDEAILILMPHTNKAGANIVAERIYQKLLKDHPEIVFSIAIASSEREDLSFTSLMTAIYDGIDASRSAGGNKIVVK
ncbi:diguanylate cyclase [bacterium]|nr:diguanylate cyclase [bacterium]